jgi:hypothetical protein
MTPKLVVCFTTTLRLSVLFHLRVDRAHTREGIVARRPGGTFPHPVDSPHTFPLTVAHLLPSFSPPKTLARD